MRLPTYADVVRAQKRLTPYLEATPLVRAQDGCGWLKLENLQATGAYKVRGALNALLVQREGGDARGVIAASAGNHSAGMAWAADRLGLSATAVVPKTAPTVKIDATRRLGATVIVHGDDFESAEAYAKALAERDGLRFLPAFDDPDVIAGQGTIALELLAARPEVVLIPIGGGGLISGMGLVLKAHDIRVVGVQVKGVDAMRHVLMGVAPLMPARTLADGVRVSAPGQLTRKVCAQVVDEIVTVDESVLQNTLLKLATTEQLVVEGAGALAPAVLSQYAHQRAIAVVSGGNIDLGSLLNLAHRARCRVPPTAGMVFRQSRQPVEGGVMVRVSNRLASVA